MMELDLTFEDSPWEQFLASLEPGSAVSAMQVLALSQDVEDQLLSQQLTDLEENRITLDITPLPREGGVGQAAQRLHREQQMVANNTLLQDLEDSDPLLLYLQELEALPRTDVEELASQVREGKAQPDVLVAPSLQRVVELAKEYTGFGVLLLDLIQEGSLGLWQGALHYEGGPFLPHRDWWIRQYLAKAVLMQARTGELGQKLRQGMEDYRDVDQRLLSELGRNPTLEEIAQAMHITAQQAEVFEAMQDQARSRQRIEAQREPVEQTPEDDQAVEDTAYFQMRQRIGELLSVLPEADAQLLTLRYGLEGGLPMKPQEVAQRLGITVQEVTQREAQALQQLREIG